MSKYHVPQTQRIALWRANGSKCFFCSSPVDYRELEIDHLVAESTSEDRVTELVTLLGLPGTFSVNAPVNLVPAHGDCNGRKSATEFSEATLRFYFGLWSNKQAAVESELAKLARQSRNEDVLARLAARVESGDLSIREVTQFLGRAGAAASQPGEPMVVGFSTNVPTSSREIVDDLVAKLGRQIPSLSVLVEDESNGETASVRVAFWNLNVEHLAGLDIDPWEVLEVSYYSDVYEDGDWASLFPKAVVSTYHEVIRGDEPNFGLSRCPTCASVDLRHSEAMDYAHDEMYYLIRCGTCGWSDWTQ